MASCASDPHLNRRHALRLGSGGVAAAFALRVAPVAAAQDLAILDANKAIARRVFGEAVNGGNGAVVAELYHPDFVDRGAPSRRMPGPAGMPMPVARFHAFFPSITVTVDAVVAEEDLVAAVATWRDTHPPAGAHVVGRTMHLFRIASSRIVEEWSVGWEWLDRRGYRPAPRLRNPLTDP